MLSRRGPDSQSVPPRRPSPSSADEVLAAQTTMSTSTAQAHARPREASTTDARPVDLSPSSRSPTTTSRPPSLQWQLLQQRQHKRRPSSTSCDLGLDHAATTSARPVSPALPTPRDIDERTPSLDAAFPPYRTTATSLPVLHLDTRRAHLPDDPASGTLPRTDDDDDDDMVLTGDGAPRTTAQAQRARSSTSTIGAGLAGWFAGASQPQGQTYSSTTSYYIPEDTSPPSPTGGEQQRRQQQYPNNPAPNESNNTPSRLKKRPDTSASPTSPVASSTSPASGRSATAAGTSRLSLIASSTMSALSRFTAASSPSTAPSPSAAADDEFLTLNVEATLFPGGERDAFSPAAYKNLAQTATGVLSKLQSAYRAQALALRELRAEHGATRDEQDEAATRARHLKLQLEDMARKAAEQQDAVGHLLLELAAERRARHDDRAAWEKGLAAAQMSSASTTEGSMVSEDLGAEDDQLRMRHQHHHGHNHNHNHNQRQQQQQRVGGGSSTAPTATAAQHGRWRKSLTLRSDAGASSLADETDEDSGADGESVFSRSRSPTLAPSVFDGGSVVDGPSAAAASAGTPQKAVVGAVALPPTAQKPPPPTRSATQMTTFQKLLKGISGETVKEEDEHGGGGPGCRNCRGQDASVAWNTVSLLRDENKSLKQRVGQLETAVEAALDLVNGVGM